MKKLTATEISLMDSFELVKLIQNRHEAIMDCYDGFHSQLDSDSEGRRDKLGIEFRDMCEELKRRFRSF